MGYAELVIYDEDGQALDWFEDWTSGMQSLLALCKTLRAEGDPREVVLAYVPNGVAEWAVGSAMASMISAGMTWEEDGVHVLSVPDEEILVSSQSKDELVRKFLDQYELLREVRNTAHS